MKGGKPILFHPSSFRLHPYSLSLFPAPCIPTVKDVQHVPIDPDRFIAAVQPLLQRQDMPGLMCLLKTRWTPDQIRGLLNSSHIDAKKVALLALGLVAPACCIPDLALQLKHPDPMV